MENRHKHLEFIQTVINRFARNSFFIKGWAITLISGLFAISSINNFNKIHFFVAYFITLMFWFLDAYYLSQERCFRSLYDNIRKIEPAEIDFSMDTTKYFIKNNSWMRTLVSKTLLLFYLPFLILITISGYFLC